ncbi:hypothetical protein [Dyadobacter bucti]|uniref:hypothetical protein n=1 Tax=Dyadobacter bucti TaxID=2572203 RepID=UPI0011085D54|nr:hypothetical protein [Dyadobacter bucti]
MNGRKGKKGTKEEREKRRKEKINTSAEPNGLKYPSPSATLGADEREYEWEDGETEEREEGGKGNWRELVAFFWVLIYF